MRRRTARTIASTAWLLGGIGLACPAMGETSECMDRMVRAASFFGFSAGQAVRTAEALELSREYRNELHRLLLGGLAVEESRIPVGFENGACASGTDDMCSLSLPDDAASASRLRPMHARIERAREVLTELETPDPDLLAWHLDDDVAIRLFLLMLLDRDRTGDAYVRMVTNATGRPQVEHARNFGRRATRPMAVLAELIAGWELGRFVAADPETRTLGEIITVLWVGIAAFTWFRWDALMGAVNRMLFGPTYDRPESIYTWASIVPIGERTRAPQPEGMPDEMFESLLRFQRNVLDGAASGTRYEHLAMNLPDGSHLELVLRTRGRTNRLALYLWRSDFGYRAGTGPMRLDDGPAPTTPSRPETGIRPARDTTFRR